MLTNSEGKQWAVFAATPSDFSNGFDMMAGGRGLYASVPALTLSVHPYDFIEEGSLFCRHTYPRSEKALVRANGIATPSRS